MIKDSLKNIDWNSKASIINGLKESTGIGVKYLTDMSFADDEILQGA